MHAAVGGGGDGKVTKKNNSEINQSDRYMKLTLVGKPQCNVQTHADGLD